MQMGSHVSLLKWHFLSSNASARLLRQQVNHNNTPCLELIKVWATHNAFTPRHVSTFIWTYKVSCWNCTSCHTWFAHKCVHHLACVNSAHAGDLFCLRGWLFASCGVGTYGSNTTSTIRQYNMADCAKSMHKYASIVSLMFDIWHFSMIAWYSCQHADLLPIAFWILEARSGLQVPQAQYVPHSVTPFYRRISTHFFILHCMGHVLWIVSDFLYTAWCTIVLCIFFVC